MIPILDRRDFLITSSMTLAAAAWPSRSLALPFSGQSQRKDHYAHGDEVAVTSTSREASEAALRMLDQGGTAADAYIAAALVQTVSEPGLTTIGGAFGMHYFEANAGKTSGVTGRLGPAAAEPYDYDRDSPVTRTGRAMPVPGFVAGIHAAHEAQGKLPWKTLFEPAIECATEGVVLLDSLIRAARTKGASDEAGKALWMKDGTFLGSGEKLVQSKLSRVLSDTASGGPEAFYRGEFASHYVKRAARDGGKITLEDMERWKDFIHVNDRQPEGNYRGHRILSGGLILYALHLNEALDLASGGVCSKDPGSMYKQVRILEEVFLAAKDFSDETRDRYVDPDYAKKRADFVLDSPLRKVTLNAIFNTCFLVVRDRQGNCAWGTHSINTPSAFGAGILVDGVYASYALNRDHVHGQGATAPGISTSYALFKEGKPRLITGSPGFGFVHGPYQYGTGIIEWNLSPIEAMNLPRFSLPNREGSILVEQHYDPAIFAMLEEKGVPHYKHRHTPSTGLVGALFVDENDHLHVIQDGRRAGWARAR